MESEYDKAGFTLNYHYHQNQEKKNCDFHLTKILCEKKIVVLIFAKRKNYVHF